MSVEGNRPGNGSNASTPELTLSPDVQQQLQALLDEQEPLRCGAEADMVLPATFGTSWLVATDRRIAVYTPNGETPDTLVDVPLAEAVKLRKRMLNGSNLLELHTGTQMVPLVRYTDARAEPVEQAAEAIRALIGEAEDEEEDQRGR